MIFFALVAFITLPISAMILMEAKKTNAASQSALTETKKLQRELKPKKEEDDE
jgi:multisubunit Na+/H+ antiporter MnhG subunit